jgi:hypothetical protein
VRERRRDLERFRDEREREREREGNGKKTSKEAGQKPMQGQARLGRTRQGNDRED